MTKVQKVPTGPFHPGYGCAILIIAFLVFGGLVSWVFYSGFEQDRQISTFTVEDAPALPIATPSAAEKEALKARLADFSKASAAGPAKLTLTTADLNALVVLWAESGVKDADNRGTFWFTGMDEKTQMLEADIHSKVNNLPFTDRKDRFLVGHVTFKPDIDTTGLELHIENVVVPGKTVSEGFIRQFRNWPWLNLVKTRPEFAEPLKKVVSFKITPEGSLVLESGIPVPAK